MSIQLMLIAKQCIFYNEKLETQMASNQGLLKENHTMEYNVAIKKNHVKNIQPQTKYLQQSQQDKQG